MSVAEIKIASPKRSEINLSHNHITSTDFGKLIPVMCEEMVPNDTFVVKASAFLRALQIACPTFGNMKLHLEHFFVPSRLLWDDFDLFITGQKNVSVPSVNYSSLGWLAGTELSLIDIGETSLPSPGKMHRGIYTDLISNIGLNQVAQISTAPSAGKGDIALNVLPFRAYQRIWWDWYRDSRLIPESSKSQYLVTDNSHLRSYAASAGDTNWYGSFAQIKPLSQQDVYARQFMCRRRCFARDYFTTAQLDGVNSNAVSVNFSSSGDVSTLHNTRTLVYSQEGIGARSTIASTEQGYVANLDVNINALRSAIALQTYLEKNGVLGSRLLNQLLGRFGIAPSAERLDMAEYLGQETQIIPVDTVTSTSSTTNAQLGEQAGNATTLLHNEITYSAKEHGYYFVIASIEPEVGYSQGINRKFLRMNNLDFFTPEYDGTGLQAIRSAELCFKYDQEGKGFATSVFGYTPRYTDYLFSHDILGGDFIRQDTYRGSDGFHLDRFFDVYQSSPLPPQLNANFVEINPPFDSITWANADSRGSLLNSTAYSGELHPDRIFQTSNNMLDHFRLNCYFDVKAIRPMRGFELPNVLTTNHGDTIELPNGGVRL